MDGPILQINWYSPAGIGISLHEVSRTHTQRPGRPAGPLTPTTTPERSGPMGLFRRISDIISANFNEMVDQFEDPEKMLKQAVREMEESIAAAKKEVVGAMASEKLVKKNLGENERQI